MHISCYNLNNMDIVSLEFCDLDVIAGGLQKQLPEQFLCAIDNQRYAEKKKYYEDMAMKK